MRPSTIDSAIRLRDILSARKLRIVLAESCTAGRIAATLGTLPGISDWLCGSFVVYRNDSKSRWLDIPSELLDAPDSGPVSAAVTEGLARSALQRTPEADVCLAITGEIGPSTPLNMDGVVYCAMIDRMRNDASCDQFHLLSPAPEDNQDMSARIDRLDEATECALKLAAEFVGNDGTSRWGASAS